MTKSAIATPGRTDGQVSTVNIEGSYQIFGFKNTSNDLEKLC
jgi:hypothetical protein